MSDQLHQRATELFSQAMDLPFEEAKAYIKKHANGDAELEAYAVKLIESLYKEKENFGARETQESTQISIPRLGQITTSKKKTGAKKTGFFSKKKNILILSITLAILTGGYFYATYIRNRLIDYEVKEHLALLNTNAALLEQWVQYEMSRVEELAEDPLIVGACLKIDSLFNKHGKEILFSSHELLTNYTEVFLEITLTEELSDLGLIHASTPITLLSANLIDEQSGLSKLNGLSIAEGAYPDYMKVSHGQTIFVPPMALGSQLFEGVEIEALYDSECIFATPVNIDNEIIGVVIIALNAQKAFGDLFTNANHGESSEVYAFNASGQMLTTSRFLDQLISSGILGTDSASILNLQLRAPGSNILEKQKIVIDEDKHNFTKIYNAAIKDLERKNPTYSGMIYDFYENYVGRQVVGAWRWFPEYNLGLIHEQDYEEFHRSIFLFDLTFLLLVIITLFGAGFAIRSNIQLSRLTKKYDKLQMLGEYKLLEKIGEGGFGEVYKGEHQFLKRPVAIKVLKKELNGTDALDRFKQEVKITASLNHPNTVKVYNYGTGRSGQFYYVMEYLNGLSLEKLLSNDYLTPVGRGIYILKQVCHSLKEAHDAGLLHRDIKPANIMVCNQGGAYDTIKLLDFGLVKQQDATLSQQTQINRIGGTPMFMAPERLRDPLNADARQDIYAIGAVGLFMFSGRYIVELISQKMLMGQETISGMLSGDVFSRNDLPEKLVEVLFKCVNFNPDERQANISELLNELNDLSTTHPWSIEDAEQWWKEYDAYA